MSEQANTVKPYDLDNACDQAIHVRATAKIPLMFMEERCRRGEMLTSNDLDMLTLALKSVEDAAGSLSHNLHELQDRSRESGP